MEKITLATVNLAALSKATNISVNTLKDVLTDNYRTSPAPISNNKFLLSRNIKEEIENCEEISELHSIFSTLSTDQPEYIICYEKLIVFLKDETTTTNDRDELDTLLSEYAPSGSPEEQEIIEKIVGLEKTEVDHEGDLYDLIDLYNDNSFHEASQKYLIAKIIATVSDPEDVYKLLSEVFPDDSFEYFEACHKHAEIVRIAISKMTSPEDADGIAPYLYAGTDEQNLLAQKIVQVATDATSIMDREDDFENNSEASEILACGAIEKYSDYENDSDELDTLVTDWGEFSRIGRLAMAKKKNLLIKHIDTLTDVDDMQDLLDEFTVGDLQKKVLMQKIVTKVDDIDALADLIDNSSEYLTVLAKEKLSKKILEDVHNARSLSAIEDYDKYVEENSLEEDMLDKKRVELCLSKDTAEDLSIRDQSYAEYLLAKKFGASVRHAVPVGAQKQNREVDESKERDNVNATTKQKIINSRGLESVMAIYNGLPSWSTNKEFAYAKASKLLAERLPFVMNRSTLLPLLAIFPKGTVEWTSIVKKLASYYKKPWWMFW